MTGWLPISKSCRMVDTRKFVLNSFLWPGYCSSSLQTYFWLLWNEVFITHTYERNDHYTTICYIRSTDIVTALHSLGSISVNLFFIIQSLVSKSSQQERAGLEHQKHSQTHAETSTMWFFWKTIRSKFSEKEGYSVTCSWHCSFYIGNHTLNSLFLHALIHVS